MKVTPPGYKANTFTSQEVKEFWDSVAHIYTHEKGALKEAHFQRFERAFSYLSLRDGAAALNIWSRNGEAIPYFRTHARSVRLVNAEISTALIREAKKRYPEEIFVQVDLKHLPFRDEEFDFVLCLETLEHTPDPLEFLRELVRVLKPGGEAVISCPPATAEIPLRLYQLFSRDHGEGPHRFLSSRRVKALLHAAGFDLELHRGTLFLPLAPAFLRRLEGVVERLAAHTPLRELGIRQFYVCRKRSDFGPWLLLLRAVIETDLCTRCGTCAGVCPEGVFEFKDTEGRCLPEPVRSERCIRCGACTEVCPGTGISFSFLHGFAGPGAAEHGLLGPFRRIRAAVATDKRIASAGSSGGVVTALLVSLLKSERVTGAVVLAPDPEKPYRPRAFVARTAEEVIAGAQSKYCVTPSGLWLSRIDPKAERLVVVALPCQVHALRKLQRSGHPKARAISLIIGLYCGNQLYFSATRSFLSRCGIKDLSRVAEVRYRDGPWPGSVRCVLKDGSSFAVPKFYFNHLISFYTVERCLLCTDLAAEGADLSVGDAWDAPIGGDLGAALVVTRSVPGEEVVAEAVARGELEVRDIDPAEAAGMHAHGFDLKKTGAPLRIAWRKRRGKPAPEYDTPPPRVSLRRKISESALLAHFAICRTSAARFVVDRIPFGLIGRLYKFARVVWRAAARRSLGKSGKEAER